MNKSFNLQSRLIKSLCFILLFSLLINTKATGQSDEKYYLIDSVDVSSLSKHDKTLMDSIMTLYYRADEDTTRLQLLDVLSNNCSEHIWPKYNEYIYSQTERYLRHPEKYGEKELRLIKGTKANTYVNRGVLFAGIGDYEKAIQQYELGLAGFREVGDSLGVSNTLTNIALLFVRQNKVDKGLELFNENVNLLTKMNNEAGLLSTYNSIAGIYRNQGQIEKSLDFLYKALKIAEKNKTTPLLCSILLNVGVIQLSLNDPLVAQKTFERALILAEEINNQTGICKALENLAMVYHDKGELDSALELNFRSLKIKESIKNYKGMALTYGQIAITYSKQKNYPKAEMNFLKAIEILEETKEKMTLANTLKNLGHFYLKIGELQKAKASGLRALNISKELGYPENIQQAAELLKSVYIKSNNWKQGYEMAELAAQMRDSIHNSTTQKALVKNQIEYEFQKEKLADSLTYAKQKELRELVIAEQDAQLSKEKTKRYSLMGILILAIVLTSVLYKNYRSKLRTNKLITEQKVLLEKKNAENELLLAEIHHRVKNNLQVVSSLLSLQERNTESEGAKSAILEGKERVKSMELVHKMLYQNNHFSGIEMQDYVQKLCLGLLESFGLSKDDVELKNKFDAITLDVDTAVPLGLIMNELIVNSLKYAKNATEKLNLKIELHLDKNNELHLNIADNGKGKVADIEKSNSFGLKIVRALIRQLNGVLDISETDGLTYNIKLKNYKLVS